MCAQLYIQRAAQPDTWVMSGAPASTTIWLSRDTAINYSDGTTDTLPANTPAVLPGGGTSVDRTHDVYVPYTVQGSGVLSIIKESLLPTLSSAYAPLARVELHGIKPYQPEPYLVAGGAGTGVPTTAVVAQTNGGTGRVRDLGAGGTPPAGWETAGFDDSAWAASVASTHLPTGTGGSELPLAGSDWVTYHDGNDRPASDIWLLRQTCTLPPGPLLSASLDVAADAYVVTFYVNGTSVYAPPFAPALGGYEVDHRTVALPVGPFLAGAVNTLAIAIENEAVVSATQLNFQLSVTSGAAGGVPDPGGHEGDLLYYHGGVWVDLPIGTAGQELTVVAGDPAWTDQPADTDTSGTVTSVALAGPTGTTVSGSPVTSSGTLALTWASQSAGTVLAAPTGSSGAPTFRALVGNDIPVDASTLVVAAGTIKGNYQAGSGVSISGNTISATGSGGSVTSVALSLPGIFSVSGSPITTSGTLAVTLATQSATTVFAGPASGSSAAPAFRALQGSDLPAAAASGGHVHAWGHFH